MHAERLELERQALVEALEPELRRGVQADEREPGDPGRRGDPDHVPGPLRTHHRRHRLRDPQRPEEVGLDDLARLGLGGLFDRSVQAVAGVVDEHIDAPEMFVYARDRGEDGCAIVDVELDGQRVRRRGEFGQPPAVARRQRDGVPALERRGRKGATQAAGRSRDQPHPHRAR